MVRLFKPLPFLFCLLFACIGWAQPQQKGRWSEVIQTSIVPVAASNLPDGQVLLWSSRDRFSFGGDGRRTYTLVFDPATNQSQELLISNTNHDMFCPGTANMADGRIIVTGGSSSPRTSIYDPNTGQWSSGPNMKVARGYHSMVTLSDGRVFTVGGSWSGGRGGKNAEIFENNQWKLLPGLPVDFVLDGANDPRGVFASDNHAWLWPAPNGKLFHAGPSANMHWLDMSNGGSYTDAGPRGDDGYSMCGTTVMYDTGKILKIGGAGSYAHATLANNRSFIIDITGDQALVEDVPDMQYGRIFLNSIVAPNGEVYAFGGNDNSNPFSDDGFETRNTPERFDPISKTWSLMEPMQVPRNYHSIGILLLDGRMLLGGGGLCGSCTTNHSDVEIYSPPYLFNTAGQLAVRPELSATPAEAFHNTTINVNSNEAISSFVLIKSSSVTHSTNNEQRRIPLNFTSNGGNSFSLEIPGSNLLPPGHYMLFANNAAGVPSVGKIINIQANCGIFTGLPGLGLDIGSGGGETFLIGLNNHVYQWNNTGNSWNKIATSPVASRIDVDENGNPWIVATNQTIHRWNGSAFQQLPGAATEIGIGGGDVYVASSGGNLFKWNGSSWTFIPLSFGVARVDVLNNGQYWAVGTDSLVYQNGFPAPKGNFKAIDISASDQGNTVYTLSASGTAHYYAGNGVYPEIASVSNGRNLSIGSDGTVWVQRAGGSILRNLSCVPSVSPPDQEAPSIPTNLVASNIGSSTVDLSWRASTDNVGVIAYYIYHGSLAIGTSYETNFQVQDLTPGTSYPLTIRAVDAAGNFSEFSQSIEVNTVAISDFFAHWPLDEDVRDAIGDAHGEVHKGASFVDDPIRGKVLSLADSGQHALVPPKPQLRVGNGGQDFSVSFWFNLKEGFTGQWRPIMQKGNYTEERTFAMWMNPGNNILNFRVSTSTSWNEGGESQSEIPINEWTHIAYIKEGQSLKLYLNGTLDQEIVLSGTTQANTGPLSIGHTRYYPKAPVSNYDDIRLYGYALSEGEIAALFSDLDCEISNVALNKPATQSSTYPNSNGRNFGAENAVDGNTDGNSYSNSLSHTLGDTDPWWEVDLGSEHDLLAIKLWNRTDCCADRLRNFHVLLSSDPFTSPGLNETINQEGVTDYFFPDLAGRETEIPLGGQGRYVRIQLAGQSFLQLAEVEIMGCEGGCSSPQNLALNQASQQSTTYGAGLASYANDGNTRGSSPWTADLQHTQNQAQPWWEVDLGQLGDIESVQLYNRSEGGSSRLKDFYVLVSSSPFSPSASLADLLNDQAIAQHFFSGVAGAQESIGIDALGRYVRVQLSGTGILHMAEVEVMGCPSGNDPCNGAEPVAINPTGPFAEDAGPQQLSASPVGGTWGGAAAADGSFDPSQGPGTYTVTYTYSNANGCIQSASEEISISAVVEGCSNPTNLALFKATKQSSTYGVGLSSYANDGNTSGTSPWSADLQHTQNEAQPWWEVDLGASSQIAQIKLYNRTNSNLGRLKDFYVLISETPFPQGTSLDELLANSSIGRSFFPGIAGAEELLNLASSGRYVRIQLSGNNILHMAEVEVWGCEGEGNSDPCADNGNSNLALNQPAEQSSTYGIGSANLANDGNEIGSSPWTADLQHTQNEAQPWWQVDLGAMAQLESIRILNRTEGGLGRLRDFYVLMSVLPFEGNASLDELLTNGNISSTFFPGVAGAEESLPLSGQGRYVRIQLSRNSILHMAEVEVLGCFSSAQANRFARTEELDFYDEQVFNFSLIPNPAEDLVHIQMDSEAFAGKPYEVKLFTLTGQLLRRDVFTGRQQALNVKHLARGLYFVEIAYNGVRKTKKLQKK